LVVARAEIALHAGAPRDVELNEIVTGILAIGRIDAPAIIACIAVGGAGIVAIVPVGRALCFPFGAFGVPRRALGFALGIALGAFGLAFRFPGRALCFSILTGCHVLFSR
jgi:hypothetical protein